MTSLTGVQWLQLTQGFVWAYVLVTRWSSGWRTMIGRPHPGDRKRTAMWFLAFVMVGYVTRWLLYPHAIDGMAADETSMWAGLHIMSGAACMGILWANKIEDER